MADSLRNALQLFTPTIVKAKKYDNQGKAFYNHDPLMIQYLGICKIVTLIDMIQRQSLSINLHFYVVPSVLPKKIKTYETTKKKTKGFKILVDSAHNCPCIATLRSIKRFFIASVRTNFNSSHCY